MVSFVFSLEPEFVSALSFAPSVSAAAFVSDAALFWLPAESVPPQPDRNADAVIIAASISAVILVPFFLNILYPPVSYYNYLFTACQAWLWAYCNKTEFFSK